MRFGSLVFFVLLAVPLVADDVDSISCGLLLKARLSDAGSKPPQRELTQAEIDKGTVERACLKSYSAGFPGGEDAFLQAGSQALREDLDHLEALFTQFLSEKKFPARRGVDPDESRKLHIQGGWDREQVLLWGNFFYIRRLYSESRTSEALAEIERVRKDFGLDIMPLENWDKLEEATYYSKQSLRNMIAVLGYASKARRTADGGERDQLARQFIHVRETLKPYFGVTGDPTLSIMVPYCKPSGR